MRDRKGQVLVETAIVVPFLFVLIFALVDFGWYLYVKNALSNAASLGARTAAVTQPLFLQGSAPLATSPGEPAATIRNNINGTFNSTPTYSAVTYELRISNAGTPLTGEGTQALPGNQVQVILSWPNFPTVTPLYSLLAYVTQSTDQNRPLTITAEASMRYE
jgi:Flp pilus assembly protein TadG